ncbi:hypothetical protein [Salinactinospora qingdaonensis]|uniref:Uncharacterized protein n=1 Tax=Salinactinospora qingdaonensis TaxID=702744 RepID=A0ABP7G827_9ACTN
MPTPHAPLILPLPETFPTPHSTAPYARRLHTALNDLPLPAGTPALTPTSSPRVLAAYYQAGLLIYDLITLTGLDYTHIHTRLAAARVTLRPPSHAATLLAIRAHHHDIPVSLPTPTESPT